MDSPVNEYPAALAGMADLYDEPDIYRHEGSSEPPGESSCQRVDSLRGIADPRGGVG